MLWVGVPRTEQHRTETTSKVATAMHDLTKLQSQISDIMNNAAAQEGDDEVGGHDDSMDAGQGGTAGHDASVGFEEDGYSGSDFADGAQPQLIEHNNAHDDDQDV